MKVLVAAPDKFRGTITAREAAEAIAAGAEAADWAARPLPLADGGEGTLDALGGANRSQLVTGPLGRPVEATWRLDGELAVIEMARASGLALAGGRAGNDPLRASSRGTGELIATAIAQGARRVIVGVGGSASTDGGAGAIEALGGRRFEDLGVSVEVACDVETPFLEAPRVFGPQKGATPRHIAELEERLQGFARQLSMTYGVELEQLPRSGAAGGLAGGLAALGATLCSGFELIATAAGLDHALQGAALVVTGEGLVDATSFSGKVVGGVLGRARSAGIGHLVVAGDVESEFRGDASLSLVARFGDRAARDQARECITRIVGEWLRSPLALDLT